MPGALDVINVLDKDGNPKPVRVWDESGTGVGPFQFVKMNARADGVAIDPATSTKQPAFGTAGTPSADVLSVQGRASMTPLKVEDPDGGPVSGSQSSAAVLFTTDMLGYQSISVQILDAGSSCTISYETSDDNTNWVATSGLSSASIGQTNGQSATTGVGLYQFSRRGRYFRARVSTYGSGTVNVVGTLSKTPVQNIPVATWAQGVGAHGVGVTGNPLRTAARAASSLYTTLSNGQTADLVATLVGALISKPFSIPENDWSYAGASGGISNTTTAVTIKAAAGSGLRNYITAIQIDAEALTNATEVAIRDGAGGTVLWRMKIGNDGLKDGREIVFPSPIKGTANTLLEVVTLTASGAGAVFVNAQGYVAP
jgi:hypothetical protein